MNTALRCDLSNTPQSFRWLPFVLTFPLIASKVVISAILSTSASVALTPRKAATLLISLFGSATTSSRATARHCCGRSSAKFR